MYLRKMNVAHFNPMICKDGCIGSKHTVISNDEYRWLTGAEVTTIKLNRCIARQWR